MPGLITPVSQELVRGTAKLNLSKFICFVTEFAIYYLLLKFLGHFSQLLHISYQREGDTC